MKKTLYVVGGGAAGMFCAVNAARLDTALEVIISEKSSKLLAKVKVSGGGRCNVTHACFSLSELIKHYPRGTSFLKKSFYHFSPADTIRWFNERGVSLKTENDGRIFPVTNDSQTIINCLLDEAARYKVDIITNQRVTGMYKRNEKWILCLASDKEIETDYVLIACGGFPKTEQFNWLTVLGHTISPPVPSLFSFNSPRHPLTKLTGISLPTVQIKIKGTSLLQTGAAIITHWGISGPAVLKLSAWAARELADKQYRFTVLINWIPGYHENSCRERLLEMPTEAPTQKIINASIFGLPSRLWNFMLDQAEINPETRWANLTARSRNLLAKLLTTYTLEVEGKTTFKEEFVTAGGIHLSEINPNTMESKLHPGLFFAGEIMDVDGITGGFNFQHAWTSGWLAARTIAGYQQMVK